MATIRSHASHKQITNCSVDPTSIKAVSTSQKAKGNELGRRSFDQLIGINNKSVYRLIFLGPF